MERGLYIVRNSAGERVNYVFRDPATDPDHSPGEGLTMVFDQGSPLPRLRAEPGPLIIRDPDI